MDYKDIKESSEGVVIYKATHFELEDIFDNGQCFRWDKVEDDYYSGIAFGRSLDVYKENDSVILKGASLGDFNSIWRSYFDLDRSYSQLIQLFSSDKTLKQATSFAPGLRLLRQEPWETLASFILSQNNNIKRIKGLVQRFSESFGKKIEGGYSFPNPESICNKLPDDLSPVRAGFRSKYLIDAAEKVVNGIVSLNSPYTIDFEDAFNHLMQIKGVGPKVANCVLLFGFHRIEALPIDVWVKRALDYFYPDGFPRQFNHVAGLAQQYLFNYTRLSPDALPKDFK